MRATAITGEAAFSGLRQPQRAAAIADLLKLVANANWLRILGHLYDREMCVSELESVLGLSQPALSQHVARLRQENILTTRRVGHRFIMRCTIGE